MHVNANRLTLVFCFHKIGISDLERADVTTKGWKRLNTKENYNLPYKVIG